MRTRPTSIFDLGIFDPGQRPVAGFSNNIEPRQLLRLEVNRHDLADATERIHHPDRPRNPHGRDVPPLLDARLLAEELPANDCPPVRVKVLSERLVAFRDSLGRYGLIDEFCAHRGVSLWFGRNEECGLRCPYHGWKFDFTGQCIEVPSEPEESGFAKKIKLQVLSAGRARRRAVDLYGPRASTSRRCRNGNSPWWRPSSASSPSACRRATGCRRWKAASIRAMSPSCIAATSTRIRCSRAPRAINTISATRGRCSRWWRARAGSTSGPAAMPRRATTIGASPSGSCRRSP